MITLPTVAQIRDQIISDIEGKIGQTVPVLPRAFFRVLATALAGVLALLYRFGAWIYDQIFPQTADSEALGRIGTQYGIIRKASVSAVLTATATGTNGTTIPAGTLWTYNGAVYQQTADADIAAGSATITIEALTSGDAGNIANGQIIKIGTPQAGVVESSAIASTVTLGEDQEAIEDYRRRIIQRLQQRPQGGAAADYVGWALEVPGIVKAFAYRTAPGDVTVYPMAALSGARVPDAPKLAEVQAYLSDDHRRPLCANVYAAALTERTFTMTVTTLQPDTSEMRAAVESAWSAHLLGRFPRQYSDEANPTDYISKAALYGEAVAAGALLIDFSLYINGSGVAISSHQLTSSELAKLGAVTWPA